MAWTESWWFQWQRFVCTTSYKGIEQRSFWPCMIQGPARARLNALHELLFLHSFPNWKLMKAVLIYDYIEDIIMFDAVKRRQEWEWGEQSLLHRRFEKLTERLNAIAVPASDETRSPLGYLLLHFRFNLILELLYLAVDWISVVDTFRLFAEGRPIIKFL